MIKKILPRILILLAVATLVSAIIVSSVFAKYTTNDSRPEVTVRPTQFNVLISSASSNMMAVNFAADGDAATEKVFSYDVTVNSADNEVAAYITLKLTLSPDMKTLVDRAPATAGISCDYAVYKVSGSTETALSGTASDAIWMSEPDLLEIGATNTYRIKLTVHHTAGTGSNFDNAEFISNAITVDVVATQVDPMK